MIAVYFYSFFNPPFTFATPPEPTTAGAPLATFFTGDAIVGCDVEQASGVAVPLMNACLCGWKGSKDDFASMLVEAIALEAWWVSGNSDGGVFGYGSFHNFEREPAEAETQVKHQGLYSTAFPACLESQIGCHTFGVAGMPVISFVL